MHEIIDERSLKFAEIIADLLEGDPGLMEVARGNLKRWKEQNAGELFPDLKSWEALIETGDLEVILKTLRGRSEHDTQLRQSNPFVGIITNQERWKILKEFNDSTAT
jgi:hypothetical protein